jgi:hypothetical protein
MNAYAREVRVEKRLVCLFVPPRGASYKVNRPQDEDDEACHGAGRGMRTLDHIRQCRWKRIPSELRCVLVQGLHRRRALPPSAPRPIVPTPTSRRRSPTPPTLYAALHLRAHGAVRESIHPRCVCEEGHVCMKGDGAGFAKSAHCRQTGGSGGHR